MTSRFGTSGCRSTAPANPPTSPDRHDTTALPQVPAFAGRPIAAVAAAVALVLVAVAGRYGYHRDELYFLAAGHHLAWGYPDRPPVVPFLARLLNNLAPGSLLALRLPSALAAAAIVVLTALIARELGGEWTAQLLAAASMAIAPPHRESSRALPQVARCCSSQVERKAMAWLTLMSSPSSVLPLHGGGSRVVQSGPPVPRASWRDSEHAPRP